MTPPPHDAASFEHAAVGRVSDALPDADLDALRASFDLIRAANRLVHQLESEVHRPAGWTMAGFRVMFCVWVSDVLEPRDIARLSGLSRAAVSSVLNTLERDGLVERTRESDDRRLVTVRLTERGRRGVVEAYERQNAVEQRFFAALDPPEIERATAALAALLAAPRASTSPVSPGSSNS